MSYLVDTNVLSEGRKPRPNRHVRAWFDSVSESSLFLSVLVVGEIRRGVEGIRRRDPRQAQAFEAWLEELRRSFTDRLLPVSVEVAEEWGRLNVPNPIPAIDGLLAATARVNGLTLVTRNVADLRATGVRLLNPFEP